MVYLFCELSIHLLNVSAVCVATSLGPIKNLDFFDIGRENNVRKQHGTKKW